MAVQRTFTGENTGVEIKPFDRLQRSQERMDDMLLKADELRYQTYKENEAKYLKAMNVDMKTYISNANMELQSKLIDEYNKKAQGILKQRGGRFENFTTQDWVELQKGKQYLQSAQAKMASDLERYQMDEKDMQRDGGRNFDTKEWNSMRDEYLKTGVYKDSPMPIKEKSFVSFLSGRSKAYTGKVDTEYDTIDVNGVKIKQKGWYNMTLDQAKQEIKDGILLRDGERKNVMSEFAKQPEQEKIKWLDTNKDGKVDQAEAGDENGIIAWAQQYKPYVEAIMRPDSSQGSNLYPNTSKNTGSKLTFEFGTGSPTRYSPTTSISTKLGDTAYSKYHPFPQFESYFIPTENVEIFNANGNKERTTQKTLKVQPTGYDEEKDEFTFKVLQNYKGGNTMGNGDDIAIKRDKVPTEFGNIVVVINGQQVPIKDIKRTITAQSSPSETPKESAKKEGELDNI